MLPIEVLSTIFLAGGAFFMITGTVGLYKFPDFYTRMHATGKCDTVGQVLIIVGCMIYSGWSYITIKLLLVSFFYLFAGPAGTHVLLKAGYIAGVRPWQKGDPRDPKD